jgi:hypothetical protein
VEVPGYDLTEVQDKLGKKYLAGINGLPYMVPNKIDCDYKKGWTVVEGPKKITVTCRGGPDGEFELTGCSEKVSRDLN